MLCPLFLNLKEFLARRREDRLSSPVWWRVSQGKFFFNENCSKIPNELTLFKTVSANYSEQVCRPLFILDSGSWPPGYISSRVSLLLFAHRDYSTQIYRETRLSGVGFNGYISSRVCLLLRHRSPRLSNPNLEKLSWRACCRTGSSRPLSYLHTRVSTLVPISKPK